MPRSLVAAVFVLSLACGKTEDTRDSGDTKGETADTATPPVDLVVQAVMNPTVSLVIDVSWQAPEPGRSWVSYGMDGQMDQQTPVLDGAASPSFHLYGLRAGTEVTFEAVTETDTRSWSKVGTVTTGAEPATFPALVARVEDASLISSEPWFIGSCTGATLPFFAIDREGNTVWYLFPEPTVAPTNFGGESLDLEDNASLVLGVADVGHTSNGPVVLRTDLVGSATTVLGTSQDTSYHHAAIGLPDGSAAWVSTDVRTWTDTSTGVTWQVMGDAIIESTPDGDLWQVFTSWDWREPEVNPYWNLTSDDAGDWTHANSLYYYPDTDSYLVSFGFASTVLEVDRTFGTVVAEYGVGRDFDIEEGSLPFYYQHDANYTADRTLLMTSHNEDSSASYIVEYEVDTSAHVLREIWSYGTDARIDPTAGGVAQRMANGNTLWGAGTTGDFFELTPDGSVAWLAQFSLGIFPFCALHPISTFYSAM